MGGLTAVLRGARVVLRARRDADVPVLHAELYEDVVTRSRADSRPWTPRDETHSPFAVGAHGERDAVFSVVEADTGELAGAADLWGVDAFARSGHLGVSLRSAFRGRGLGSDVVAVLCEYGFTVRGLHRLTIETLADNHAMQSAARKAGFVQEGRLRESAWVCGARHDELLFGLLARDHSPGRAA